ncbi:MAG: hypothetical protein ABIR04_06665, partial [Cypionkella sp.]
TASPSPISPTTHNCFFVHQSHASMGLCRGKGGIYVDIIDRKNKQVATKIPTKYSCRLAALADAKTSGI